jgi:hypothetical protein
MFGFDAEVPMSEQEDLESREAKHGEKMIWLKVGFWTDTIAPEPGKVIPRRAWASGVVRMQRNESHGIDPGDPLPFNSLPELVAAIEDLLIRQGITLHASRKMQKYVKDK